MNGWIYQLRVKAETSATGLGVWKETVMTVWRCIMNRRETRVTEWEDGVYNVGKQQMDEAPQNKANETLYGAPATQMRLPISLRTRLTRSRFPPLSVGLGSAVEEVGVALVEVLSSVEVGVGVSLGVVCVVVCV